MAHETLPKDCWSRTPHYRPGGKLSAEQLNAGQADAVKRDRLVNVAMHGVGVAYGYEIRTDDAKQIVIDSGCIYVGCGLAFDKYGRMLFWRGGWISMKDIIGKRPHCEGLYTLCVHYAEKTDRGGRFDPYQEGTDWIDRCVAFTLELKRKEWDCCAPDLPTDACMTRKDWICIRNGFQPGAVPKDEALDCACADPPELCASNCGRVAYDPDARLPLSGIAVCDLDADKHDCDPRYDFCPCNLVDNCFVRPVAYRSRLLYELMNLDDVPRAKIRSYSWSAWWMKCWDDQHRVPFGRFKERAKSCREEGDPNPRDGFSVMFDRPVLRCTLHPLSVLMEIHIRENRPHYWKPARIPIDIRYLDENGYLLEEPCEEDCVWGIVICPFDDWIGYELDDTNSTILDCAKRGQLARVEITLRGQIIRDCCGLMIDARPPDLDEKDSCRDRAGQARVGGDWISVFRVGPEEAPGHGYSDNDTAPKYQIEDDKTLPPGAAEPDEAEDAYGNDGPDEEAR